MPAKPPICIARRSHLSLLASTPLIAPLSIPFIGSLGGCSGPVRRMPNANLPRQKPEQFAMLPIEAENRIRLEHLASARTFSGRSAGMSRTALWENQSSRSRDFTRVLKQNGLAPSRYLNQQLMAIASLNSVALTQLTNATAIKAAIGDWEFDSIASKADAVVFLEISDIAFSSQHANTFWPKIFATMTVAATRDSTQLGEQHYQVRINAEPADQRDKQPEPLGKFRNANELMANPRLVVKILNGELDKIAHLMVSDLQKLSMGREMKWGSV